MMYTIEASYDRKQLKWECIAKFSELIAAQGYLSRHQRDGGGKLRIVETTDDNPLEFAADCNASFTYMPEAHTYAYA